MKDLVGRFIEEGGDKYNLLTTKALGYHDTIMKLEQELNKIRTDNIAKAHNMVFKSPEKTAKEKELISAKKLLSTFYKDVETARTSLKDATEGNASESTLKNRDKMLETAQSKALAQEDVVKAAKLAVGLEKGTTSKYLEDLKTEYGSEDLTFERGEVLEKLVKAEEDRLKILLEEKYNAKVADYKKNNPSGGWKAVGQAWLLKTKALMKSVTVPMHKFQFAGDKDGTGLNGQLDSTKYAGAHQQGTLGDYQARLKAEGSDLDWQKKLLEAQLKVAKEDLKLNKQVNYNRVSTSNVTHVMYAIP